MNARPIPLWRRILASFLLAQLALGPLASPAVAQTLLADEPIGFSPSAPPNIVLTVDDSTSMLSDFLPDYVIGAFCRDSNGSMTAACGFVGQAGNATTHSGQPQYVYSAGQTLSSAASGFIPFPKYATGNPPNTLPYANSSIPDWFRAWPAPIHSNAMNRLYYEPSIEYKPPVKADGSSYPDMSSWTAVPADPWATTLKTEDLTANVRVGMWCNSNHPDNTGWNPGTGGGTECRINGTDYSGVALPVPADYNYPWRNTAANDARTFNQNGAGLGWTNASPGPVWNKVIYCNTAHPKFPKSLPCAITGYTCPVPQTYIPPAAVPQYCYDVGNKTGSCTNTYNPPACNTNPLYGAPGPCVGPECLVCQNLGCTPPSIGREGQCGTNSSRPQPPSTRADCDCAGAGCTVNANHAACVPVTPPGVGTCSGGATPTPVRTCNNNNSNDCGLRLYNPVSGLNDGPRMIDDANGTGEVCRRNGRAYAVAPVVSASPFNYPAAPYTTAKNNATCGVVPGSASINRHYWKTSVEWCSAANAAGNDRWRTYGKAGTCQDERTSVFRFPRFYKYGVPNTDPAYLDNYTYPAFERVDLKPGATFTHTFWRTGAFQTITRTYSEEMTNYANWFAYYRTRIQAAKTVVSQNFGYLDDAYRIGFHTLSNDPPASYVDIESFDATQKSAWYAQLFGIKIRMQEDTPNMDAVVRIGELFKNGGNAALSGSGDPITLSCQKNYHMLFTDGITNQVALPSFTVGNVDSIVPALPKPLVVAPPIIAGAAWPNLYREDPANTLADTMADYATHYWVTDLRPGMTDNVFRGKDPAPWQHLNFAALSLGTEGTLPSAGVVTENAIAAGTLKWPKPVPNQFKPGPTGVDDLWHAAVNGRGRFVNAKTSQQLGKGIAQILSDITSPSGSLVGASIPNPNLSPTSKHAYMAMFLPGWGGSVQKVEIDPYTAAPVAVTWDAEPVLTAQVTPTVPLPTPWITERRIVTMNESGTPVPFLAANLGPTQLSTLGPDATYQSKVIDYLRGDRSMEGEDIGQFRVRVSPLADIVNSQPVVVGASDWQYLEGNDPGYTAFKASVAGRAGRVYVGSNGGMIHAFDDANGKEAWAFVPPDFYRKAPPVSNDKAGLLGLTYQPGDLPQYAHRFYADATPRVVDAYVGGAWKTLMVAGLGKGGKSYYAFDVTNPSGVTDEASAASKVMWRFTDADLGYTFGRATIIKTRAFGGKWVVVVPSGHNNTSGKGKLFFLDAATGSLLKTMSTGEGSAGNPSGLAHINAYVQDYRNQLADQIYGGDLLGNLWRFNIKDANDALWSVEKIARLTDNGGAVQPITIEPMIEVDISNGVDRWVFVGTGKLTHACDLPDYYAANSGVGKECDGQPNPSQLQRMYAMRDGTYDTPKVFGAPLTFASLDAVSGIAGLGAGVIAVNGWYDDLPADQRIVRPIAATVGLVAYISTGFPTDPCEVGQPANVYVRQFGNGESRLESSPGTFVETIYEPEGGAGLAIVSVIDPSCTSNCVPQLKLAVTTSGPGRPELKLFGAKLPGILNQSRISWRQLGQ